MEKKITLVLLLCVVMNYLAFTQDKVDPRPLDGSLFPDTIYDVNFHKNHFIRGWNFVTGTRELNEALGINYCLNGATLGALGNALNNNKNPEGQRWTYSYYYVFHSRSNPDVKYFNGHSLYLKPYITVDTSNYFEPKPDEGTGAVFGFLTKALGDTATEVIGNDAFHTFRLNKTQVTPGNPVTVLSNPWRNDVLRYLNYSGLDSLKNGKIWYLTLNLRSRDTIIPGWLMDSTILTIRIKYRTNKNTIDSISFWNFPTDTLKYIISDRGDTLGLVKDPGVDTNSMVIKEWKIKARNLVTDTINSKAGKLITLSALFYNNGIDDTIHPTRYNPKFTPDGNGNKIFDTLFITNIDVVVLYHGHLDLSINYIRIETPQAQAIFRGKYDQWLAEQIDTLNKIVRDPTKNRCNMRIHRFYTQDEPIPSEWAATRYVNKLLNGLGVVETNVNHVGYYPGSGNPIGKHFYQNFLRATDFDMLWQGFTFGWGCASYVPYIRRGKAMVFIQGDSVSWCNAGPFRYTNFFNFWGGYKGSYWFRRLKDNSCMRSEVDPAMSHLFDTLNSEYDIKYITSVYHNYMHDSHFFRDALYKRPWVAYLWTSSFYWNLFREDVFRWPIGIPCVDSCAGRTVDSVFFGDWILSPEKGAGRPLAGEELRLQTWTPILLGAKGLVYWRAKVEIGYNASAPKRFPKVIGLVNYDTLTPYIPPGENFVYSDSIGGDYIKSNGIIFNDEGMRWKDFFKQGISNVFRLDSLGIDSNHIYIGMKSNRAEIMKLHRWVEAVEDTLLKLKLLSWYYYGGRPYNGSSDVKEIFYSQDPKVTLDTALKNYIKLDGITTRRIDNGVYDPDSLRFFLLSLFRWEDDTTMFHRTKLDEFYIGVLNPRTDPLVRTFDTIRNQQGEILFIDSSMKFYSTAEYDIGVRYGNYTHIWNPSTNLYEWRDTSYWQSLWWKRQGCREISIPFNVPMDELLCACGYPTHYTVRVTELGANDTNLNKEFWRDARYYHKVDTTMYGFVGGENYYLPWPYRDYTLKVRLLPGEGKILKVKITHECPPIVAGSILPTSQTKIVTHPLGRVQQWRRDSIRHHFVYHRKDSTLGRSKVYYRRSLPLYPDSTMIPKLQWSPEICLSDSIRCWREPEQIITNADCGYPSLVVRYDSVSGKTKVYVTFVCRDADSLANFNDCLFSNEPRYNCPNSDYTVIAECMFNADDTVQTFQPAQAIHWACGDDIATWGVPVVNASAWGNYYAWADSIAGIVTGYKRPWENEFPNGFNFSMSSFKFSSNGIAINPSLPSYSRIFYNEDRAPIVWQEKSNAVSPYNAYYSLLKVDTSGFFVRHYLPVGVGNNNPSFVFNPDSSIVELGLVNELAEHPVVYRDVKDSLQPPGPEQILDLVAWGTQRTDTVGVCRFVRTITLQHFLNNREIVATSIKPRVSLHTDYTNFHLRFPVLSQGSSGSMENHQGPAILEMIVEDSCPSTENFEKKVLHIPYDYFVTESPYSEVIHSGASLVQLSRRPFVSIQNDWWQNLRLLQKDSSIAEFCASTRKFWRRRDEEPKPFVFFGFCDTNGTNALTNAYLDGSQLKWYTKTIYPELDPTTRYLFIPFVQRDTFYTEWFRSKDVSTLNLIFNKTSSNLFNISIQRQSDRRTAVLPVGLEPASKVRNLVYQLVGRTPEERYRLVIAKTNADAQFCQQIILMPELFSEDYLARQTDDFPKIFDLETMGENPNTSQNIQIVVLPNPAKEEIFITAYLPNEVLSSTNTKHTKIKLQIFNSLGQKIEETTVLSGETKKISLRNLPNGIYFVLATCNAILEDYISGACPFFINTK